MKKFKPSFAKFIRFSDLSSLNEENTYFILKLIKNTFGEGYYSDKNINQVVSFDVQTVGTTEYLNFRIRTNEIFSFLDDNGFSESVGGNLNFYSVIFDEKNPLNGSTENPIRIPYGLFPVNTVVGYSKENIPILYANGTPQLSSDFSISRDSEYSKISFSRIRGGYIYPIPRDKNGKFNTKVVTGATFLEFKQDFCDDNLNCYLDFGFLNTVSTNKYLVLRVTSLGLETYYHIPKNLPIYNNNLYYLTSVDKPNVVIINFSEFILNDNDTVEFYFIENSPPSITTTSETFINQYNINVENLLVDTNSSAIVLALDEQNGKFINLSNLNSQLATNIYTINTSYGKIQINTSYLPNPQSKVFVVNYYYAPPIKVYPNIDYLNNLSFYGTFGSSIPITSKPKAIQIYAKNTHIPFYGTTYYNSSSNIVSEPYVYDTLPYFLLSESAINDSQYTYIGSVTVNTDNSTNFSPSSNIQVPYQNLINLAQQINPPPKWRTLNINKSEFSSGTNTTIVIPILPVVTENNKVTSIKAIHLKLRVYVYDINNSQVDIPFDLKLSLRDGNTIKNTTTLGSSLSTATSQVYQYGNNNLFGSTSLMSYNFNSSSDVAPIYYLEFSASSTNYFVVFDYAIIYFEIY